MAKDALPPLYQLQQPERLDKLLAEEQEDCLPCRVVGASAFIGLGAYSYLSGQHQLQQQRAKILSSKSMFGMQARQAGITVMATALVMMGLYRLRN